MEINLSDLDNLNSTNPYDTFNYNSYENQNVDNYWDQPPKQENNDKNKKKKVSFNDILSNMNIVVNNQGVLQFMQPVQQEQHQYQQNQYQQNQYNSNDLSQHSQVPIDPSVKHSYIYNKYFKDYSNQNTQKLGPRVPKTIEEYKQMLLDDKIKAIQHKITIEQIKSKKMFFTSVPGVSSNPRNIQASKNNLRSMNFR
jgi:hypothetical protein